jgi:hypothetical protein
MRSQIVLLIQERGRRRAALGQQRYDWIVLDHVAPYCSQREQKDGVAEVNLRPLSTSA